VRAWSNERGVAVRCRTVYIATSVNACRVARTVPTVTIAPHITRASRIVDRELGGEASSVVQAMVETAVLTAYDSAGNVLSSAALRD
jgi:hypothetical protein